MLRATEYAEKTHTGLQRRENEDSAYARAPVFVVADGMGGAQAGEVASKIAVDAFAQGLPDTGSAEERLAVRAREANRQIYELSRAEHERAGMGTTLTAAYLDDADLAIAHVGDSRAYLLRDGELQRLTRDHSLVEELKLQGKLTEEQAAEHPQRSIITRALGPEAYVEVDTWTYPVRAGDVVLLCSDGLTSMVSEARVAAILNAIPGLEAAAAALIDEANRAGGRDNITVVLFRLEEVAADPSLEQPTMVGLVAPGGQAGAAAGSDGEQAASGSRSGAGAPESETAGAVQAQAPAPPPAPAATRTRARLARTQGRPRRQPSTPRSRRLRGKPAAAAVATVIVLFVVGAGGWIASRGVYFLGTNPQGLVTVFRGLPYDLPAGIHLYESYYVSGVPASALPADRRKKLLDHQLRSQRDASNLVRDLELGRVAR
jgi:protein phosphatase